MSLETAPVGPRGLAIRCAFQGLTAAEDGAPVNACPYGRARPFSRRAWLSGYAAGRREAGDRMPADVADEVDEDAPAPGAD